MNLAPTLGKQKWRSCSSQTTPRATKLLAPKPLSMFVEPQDQNPSMYHLLHSHILILFQCYPSVAHGRTNLQYFYQDLVIYGPPALQHSTRSCELIFGNDASCILSSHLVVSATCLFPLVGQQILFNNYLHFCPLQHILLNKNAFITKKFIHDFFVKNNKNNKIINKVFFQQN